MYDAVFVLIEAFNKFLRKKIDKNNPKRIIGLTNAGQQHNGTLDCNSNHGWVSHFEHGDKVARLLRKVSF